jgi:hypothetical protein
MLLPLASILCPPKSSLSFPPPTTLPALQRFLGMLNFYRRFLPAIAHVLRPLTDACSSQHPFHWTPAMDSAFQTAKCLLASAVPLHHPIPSAVLSLATDASDFFIMYFSLPKSIPPHPLGGIRVRKHWRAVYYFISYYITTLHRLSCYDNIPFILV